MSVHMSIMTGKLKDFRAINTNTVTNEFCIKMYKSKNKKIICTKCYSHDMLNSFRKNNQGVLQKNSDLLSKHYIDNHYSYTHLDTITPPEKPVAFTQFDITKGKFKPEAGEQFGAWTGFGFGAMGRIISPLAPLLQSKGYLKDIDIR